MKSNAHHRALGLVAVALWWTASASAQDVAAAVPSADEPRVSEAAPASEAEAEAGPGEAAPDEAPEPPLRVGVAGNAPFVIAPRDGPLDGISVQLWAATADRLHLRYELVPLSSVGAAIDALEEGEVDVVIGPVSITAERARRVSFTQPYFESDLAILAPIEGASAWDRIAPFFSRAFVLGLVGLLVVLVLVGSALWYVERGRNPTFPRAASAGIGEGVWLAVVTMTTVGYGDRVPMTRAGRAIAGVWMLVAMVSASSLTAGIATALTLSLSDAGHARIERADQLRGLRVGSVPGTTGESFARRRGARVVGEPDVAGLVHAVTGGDADAAIFDRPSLAYALRNEPALELQLSEASYEPQNYGFAFPLHSALRHDVSVVLLDLADEGVIRNIVEGWI